MRPIVTHQHNYFIYTIDIHHIHENVKNFFGAQPAIAFRLDVRCACE